MIEKALNTDGPSILKLTAAIDIFSVTEVSCVEELWNAYQDKGEGASGYTFLVYRDADRILGYACFGPHPLTQGTFDLYWIAVDPMARRHGIGHALLSRVEAEVPVRAGRLLLVETSSTPAYAPTRRFYEACGYSCVATIPDFYAPGDDLLVFAKRLQDAPTVQPQGLSKLVPTWRPPLLRRGNWRKRWAAWLGGCGRMRPPHQAARTFLNYPGG